MCMLAEKKDLAMKKFLMTIMLVAVMAGMVSACGKMSENEPVPGSGYPHSYPRR